MVKNCLHCPTEKPWLEFAPKYDGRGLVADIWVRLECPRCHVMTQACKSEEDAEREWNERKVFNGN